MRIQRIPRKRRTYSRTLQCLLYLVTTVSVLIWGALITTFPLPSGATVEHLRDGKMVGLSTFSSVSINQTRWILRPCATALEPIDRTQFEDLEPDMGHFVRFQSVGNNRNINVSDHLTYELEREEHLERMDQAEVNMNRRNFYHDDEIEDDPPDQCFRPNWKSDFHPNCNNFHEIDVLGAMSREWLVYRGEATYRAAWTYDSDWVLKTIRFPWMLGLKIALGLQKEANIMDVLSESPRVIDIYGFCGLNSIAEYMPHETEANIARQLTRDQIVDIRESENTTRSLNSLSSLEALDTSIRLAESVADLHGFEGGAIAHGDLNTEQWLMNAHGEIKLNDFNNGFILDWNHDEQRYCGQFHKFAGAFFPPETHRAFPNVTEQVDIFGFGGSLYTIMTGLYPYWQYDRKDRNRRIRKGAPIPMGSYWRQNNTLDLFLSDLIWWCTDSDVSKRPSIFEVIQELRKIRGIFLEGKLLGRRENDPPLARALQ